MGQQNWNHKTTLDIPTMKERACFLLQPWKNMFFITTMKERFCMSTCKYEFVCHWTKAQQRYCESERLTARSPPQRPKPYPLHTQAHTAQQPKNKNLILLSLTQHSVSAVEHLHYYPQNKLNILYNYTHMMSCSHCMFSREIM